jgi:two-component system chemotaxis sensor kinase CheA
VNDPSRRRVSSRFLDHVVLPREISTFEAQYLRRMNRIGLAFFLLHIPVMGVIAWANGTGALLALALSSAVSAGPLIAWVSLGNPRSISVTYGVAAMCMGGVLVHFGQGPVQIEMHFYFFALIAMLAVFGNPAVIVAAAVTVALHHLALWFMVPRSVFNYDAPVWVVAVHVAFVALESVAACFIARSFFDNVIGLEKIVRTRTAELDARSREMLLVLDNVAQGLATIARSGVPSTERSRMLDTWFGAAARGTETIFDVFARHDAGFAERSRVAWEEVVAGVMPLALTLEQMPAHLEVGAFHYRVVYLPIGEAEAPEDFLVVVTDVTAEVRRERAELDQREALCLFERMLSDRTAVNDFIEEGATLVRALAAGGATDLVTLKRMVHTLKGNSAIFGLRSLSSICHELESFAVEEGRLPPEEVARLTGAWERLSGQVERLAGVRRQVIEIDAVQHEALENLVRSAAPRAVVLHQLRALKLEPAQRRLELLGEQARRIAERLEKSVEVRVLGRNLRLDPRRWASFWGAFIHAVRNAIDHGVEGPAERRNANKPERAVVTLETSLTGDRFVVGIADDGRGIDWGRIAARAAELGVPAKTEMEQRRALFEDGVSTAARVTDTSGRGLGMGALLAATEALGGAIEIETQPGHGTTLRMVFPCAAMAPERPTRTTPSMATA